MCCCQQIISSSDKCYSRKASSQVVPVDNQRSCKLHRIIPTEPIGLGKLHGPIDDSRGQRNKLVFCLAMVEQQRDRPISLIQRYPSGCPMACRKGCGNFYAGDRSQHNRVFGGRVRDGINPGTPWFGQVAFRQGTGIQIEITHPFGPRISRMMLLNDGPQERSRLARTSARVVAQWAACCCSSVLNSASNPVARRTAAERCRAERGAAGVGRRSHSARCSWTSCEAGCPRRLASA